MKVRGLTVCVVLLLLTSPALCTFDTRPLERHLRRLESHIHLLAPTSFTHRYPNGKVQERFRVTSQSYTYWAYGTDGSLQLEWTLRKNGQFVYEAWYALRQSKERLQEDERTVSYSSFYRNQQKWEQYTQNREKGLTSYYVYDEKGKLLINDL